MPRLFSECRGIPKKDCPDNEKCIFVNGQKYQYCRLSGKYRLNKETGKAVLRKTQKMRMEKGLKIYHALSQKPGEKEAVKTLEYLQKEAQQLVAEEEAKPLTPKNQTRKMSAAKKRVGQFLLNTTFRRKANYLTKKCLDSGLCLAFGTEAKRIKDLFRGFKGLAFIQPPIKRIGTPSANGFVHEIHYRRHGYDAYAVLKSSASTTSDSLFYEYLIGKEINKLVPILPSFVETYGIYAYKDEAAWNHAKTTAVITTNSLFDSLENMEDKYPTQDEQFVKSCLNAKHIAVMIQHLKNIDSLYNKMKEVEFYNNDLIPVLFQVYASLATLGRDFTHYDLHTNNVFTYQPLPDSYIRYHYHLEGGKTVVFNCRYMAKIIDYGRSYFKNESEKIYEKVCRLCSNGDSKCGNKSGYQWLQDEKGDLISSLNSYITSRFSNISHDLRLLYLVKLNTESKQFPKKLGKLLDKIDYKTKYGTPEKKKMGFPKKINNISDAFKGLLELMEDRPEIAKNTAHYQGHVGLKKLGDLHIHLDTMESMRFIKA
jgi:hypothetical protein